MMTTEEKRIKIAEACGKGWTLADDGWWDGPSGLKEGLPFETMVERLPDYFHDLNAMHEAEKVLGDKWMPYARKLLEITTGCGDNMPLGFLNGATLCSAVHATAAQRAEAFLKTIGKWKE